jgi:NRPS condensation-like uncharacterized protein
VLDEFYLHLDRRDEPFTVHFEVAFARRLEPERLVEAIEAAAMRHPMARARLRRSRALDVRYHWEITDRLGGSPLEVVDCPDDAALDAARRRLLSQSVPLTAAPPFSLLLAHHRLGDRLMLSLHHAAGDGISAVRLMASILRAYAGQPDPLSGGDPLAIRETFSAQAGRSWTDRLARGRHLAQHLSELTAPPARVAREGGRDRGGYGFELLAFGPAQSRAIFARRRDGATVNDVLLGALASAIWRWNEDHGVGLERLALTMPVNLRPADWSSEGIGNFAACVRVPVAPRRLSPAEVIATVARQTRRIKQQRRAGLAVDLLSLSSPLPTAAKRHFRHLLPLTGNSIVDSAVLSNLGRVMALPALPSGAGAARGVYFSPPGPMPLGVALGAATAGDRLSITLRYRHAQFDASAAAAFADLYRSELLHHSPAAALPLAS